jgi:hypothetical protein
MKWECIAVTLEDYQTFLESIRRIKDENTKYLYDILTKKVLPTIESREDEQRRKALRKAKELDNLQKLALAKRSSRIADKMQRQKEQDEMEAVERKRQAELLMAKKEQEHQQHLEEVKYIRDCSTLSKLIWIYLQARQSRIMTREQRIREREMKRILNEEELKRLEREREKALNNESRLSERHLKAELKRRQEELQQLTQTESWIFDCSKCGVHGENLVGNQKKTC